MWVFSPELTAPWTAVCAGYGENTEHSVLLSWILPFNLPPALGVGTPMLSPFQMTLMSGQRGRCPLLSNSPVFLNVCGPGWRGHVPEAEAEGYCQGDLGSVLLSAPVMHHFVGIL